MRFIMSVSVMKSLKQLDYIHFGLMEKGWTLVQDLKVGDLLVSSDGTKLEIDKIEKAPRQTTVYNFMVDGYHSYFVS
ncbi:polymorphic toxin-type HINT domain-containing protein [Paenibacillus sp. SN-8-1]|uniref:polymorphic toxin-type HINT domain-containing protein n=1 Tax=Paenibacillus sp. SN-8-1 TaxID=3435409 RepID=UPI003D9A54D6